jgi:hypothetical protein
MFNMLLDRETQLMAAARRVGCVPDNVEVRQHKNQPFRSA